MTYETILYEVADRIATITFNRPHRYNAINEQMAKELSDAYSRAERDDEVWTLIVTATGKAFCSGADVEKIPEDGKVPHEGRYLSDYREWEAPQEATPPFRTMAKPIVVAVNGICCGAGMDLVTTGDISIAAEDATFFDPHVSIGLVAGREMVRVARTLPINVAMRMALLGKHDRLSAQRAYDLGFITEVVAPDELGRRARELARDGQPERATRPSGAPDWPSARDWDSHSTRPRSWLRPSGSGCSTPRTPSRGPGPSSKSGNRNGGASDGRP